MFDKVQLREELEVLSVLGKPSKIQFRADNGGQVVTETKVLGIYNDGEAEFLRGENGLYIPLDAIISVNGEATSNFC